MIFILPGNDAWIHHQFNQVPPREGITEGSINNTLEKGMNPLIPQAMD